MPKKESNPGEIHLRIIEVLKRFPEGISGGQIRQELEKEGLRPEEQTHLDRRKRDLKKWFLIQKIKATREVGGKQRNVVLYKYLGERTHIADEGQVDESYEQKSFARPMAGVKCVAEPSRSMALRL